MTARLPQPGHEGCGGSEMTKDQEHGEKRGMVSTDRAQKLGLSADADAEATDNDDEE